MNLVDWSIIITLSVLGFIGWAIGIIKAALIIVAIVVGLVLSISYHLEIADLILNIGFFEENSTLRTTVAVVVIFAITFASALVLSSILKKILTKLSLGWMDNAAGAVVAITIGSYVFALMILNVEIIPINVVTQEVHESYLAEILASRFYQYLPDSLKSLLPVTQADNLILTTYD